MHLQVLSLQVGPASEGESMFALFDEEQPVAESAGLAVSAEHNVFQYIITKNRAHKTPAQLLSEATTETRQFHYGKEGHHQWVETGEMGPLSAAAARRFGRPKGSFIYCTPTIPSRDTDSARQLACLRLMFEITLAGDRRRVGSMLAPCALKVALR